MAELQPPEPPVTADTTTTIAATTATTTTLPPSTENVGPPPAPKRQRRPSVRLGEIGDQPATISSDSHLRRTKLHWRLPKEFSNPSSKFSKSRPLTGGDFQQTLNSEARNVNGDGDFEFGIRKGKAKRATSAKRVRTNWTSKVAEAAEGDSREEGDEGFRDFYQDSDSPLKDHSPVNSVDNVGFDMWHRHRRLDRARVSEIRDNDAIELDCENGVKTWLIELGLSRYAPVFEIHEVDDEVLPMLTLEDLKDMGINAVGSRRKLYSAIQKLRKAFS